jgi:hypothetical protein
MLETATEQQTKLNQMVAALENQEKALSIMNKKLAVLNNQVDYAVFAKRKQEAIAKVQAAQFILNDSGTKVENGKQVSFIGSTAGWVTKDWSGNLMMLGCAHGVKDSYDANPKHEFEIILGDLKFKTTLAQDLPKGLKAYSSSQDLCWIAVPNDPKIRQKLEKLALPMANLMNKTIPAGTEAIAIGSPLDTIRYVTEGIISEQDHTGTRKNRGQSSIYPLLYSDAGTNSGNSGGPLIAYNWESNEWEVVASTVAKQNDTFHFAICTPLSAYQAFLSERGMNTVDKKDPKAVRHAEEILEPDRGFPLKQRKIIDKYLEGVFAEVKVDLNEWLKKNDLTREGYINDILQKRFHPMTESPQYQKRIMLPFLNVDQPFTDAETALKEMVKKVVLNQN